VINGDGTRLLGHRGLRFFGESCIKTKRPLGVSGLGKSAF
jgi:hypothetical protein